MHTTYRTQGLAFALFVLACVAAVVLAGVTVLGMQLTPATALGAAAVTIVLFAAIAFLHDAHRAARWNAGHRLR